MPPPKCGEIIKVNEKEVGFGVWGLWEVVRYESQVSSMLSGL